MARAFVFDEPIPPGIDAAAFKTNVETATGGRVEVDIANGVIRARGALNNYDRDAMLKAMPKAAAGVVETLVQTLARCKAKGDRSKAGSNPLCTVPRSLSEPNSACKLFDRTHFLDIPWKLEECDRSIDPDILRAAQAGIDEARLDVSTAGK